MGVVVNLFLTALNYTVFNLWVMILVMPCLLLKIYLKASIKKLAVNARLDGKTVIITGGNKGIGFETAKELSQRGARVILACRNVGSAHLAKNIIIHETKNDDIAVKRMDLSSIWSVKQFVKEILEEENKIDMLILNAGAGLVGINNTDDQLPLGWQVNQFSSVLLIDSLIERMKKSGPGKIIFVNSSLHHFGKIESLSMDEYDKTTCPWRLHCNTRLANLFSANYLAEKLKETGITVNSVNPGFVNTPLWKRSKVEVIKYIMSAIEDHFGMDFVDGAATTLTVALDPKLKTVTGEYFRNCKISQCKSKKANDTKLGEKIWKMSEDALGLAQDERLQ